MISLDIFDGIDIEKHWYAAFSGGPDSVCLLELMIRKRQQVEKNTGFKMNLSAIHVNHNLRVDEADRDVLFCVDFCKKRGIDLVCHNVYVDDYVLKNKISTEQAARILRYEVFSRYDDGYVFLGHNKDDNAETVFLNMIRGSGLSGISGMQRESAHYQRPLLDYSKQDILKFNQDNHVPYVYDSTNSLSVYFRNFLRLEIFPLLNKKYDKDISDNILSMASIVKQANDYIEKHVEIEYTRRAHMENDVVTVDVKGFFELDGIITSGILRKAILHVKGNLTDIEKKHIDMIENHILKGQSGTYLSIKDNICIMILQNERIRIYRQGIKRKDSADFPVVSINIPGTTHIEALNMHIKACIIEYQDQPLFGDDFVLLDFKSVSQGMVIRNRQPRDVISPYKGSGSKTLKKYFIDKKIDIDKRHNLFVLAVGNQIVYIENNEIGKAFLPKKGKETVRLEFCNYERTV